jgi:non-specific serine/threonine protein kinase/serine/threonine-protein kinase
MSVRPLDEEAIFNVARKIDSPEARSDYLQQVCGEDRAVRARVLALLRIHEEAASFLESPVVGSLASAEEPISERPGSVIGPYRLLEQIGEGGFGIVFMAEQQEPIRRKVALKVLKPGMDTRQVIARFEAERQALALMDHPNIARVLDAGQTSSGRPYFVMDLVKGVPITEFCDHSQLTPRERLELFVPVCQAIQHAHQKGIIHRDIKPSNVLVTLHDGEPLVKVIDFGIAKALGQQLTDKSLFTGFAQMIGTPLYMSPEQAALSNVDVDTRSDIYSLGVLLYELLTGTTPFDKERLQEAGYDEFRRIVREEEPPSLSTRMCTLGQRATTVSTQRKSDPRRLSQLFRGELDWIVMKALEKDRNRRFETASAFAADVQRYLHDEPVQACPPSAAYRLRKFLRRNQGPVLAAGLVLLALVGGIIGTSLGLVQAWRAEAIARSEAEQKEIARAGEARQREQAEVERMRAVQAEQATKAQARITQAVNVFLLGDLLGQANLANQPFLGPTVERNPNITIGELLDRAARVIHSRFEDQPLTEAAIRLTIGDAYLQLGRLAESEVHLERAVRLRTATMGADHSDTLASKTALAALLYRQAKYRQVESLCQEVLAGLTARLGADHVDTLVSKSNLACVYLDQGRYDAAELLLQEVFQGFATRLGVDHPATLRSKSNLAELYHRQGKYDRAEPILERVLDAFTARLGADHPDTLNCKNSLAALYQVQGKHDRARLLLEELRDIQVAKLGRDHPDTLTSMTNLARSYHELGRHADALALREKTLALQKATLGPDHPDTLEHGGRGEKPGLARPWRGGRACHRRVRRAGRGPGRRSALDP